MDVIYTKVKVIYFRFHGV